MQLLGLAFILYVLKNRAQIETAGTIEIFGQTLKINYDVTITVGQLTNRY